MAESTEPAESAAYDDVRNPSLTSRFTPTEVEMRGMVVAANDRAERLARRILAAERAVKQGQPSSVVLSVLGGAHDA